MYDLGMAMYNFGMGLRLGELCIVNGYCEDKRGIGLVD